MNIQTDARTPGEHRGLQQLLVSTGHLRRQSTLLAAIAQGRPARDEHGHLGCGAQQACDDGPGVQDVFEIVQRCSASSSVRPTNDAGAAGSVFGPARAVGWPEFLDGGVGQAAEADLVPAGGVPHDEWQIVGGQPWWRSQRAPSRGCQPVLAISGL